MVFHQLWPNTQKALGPTTSGGFIEVNNCLIWCSTAHKPFGSTFVPPSLVNWSVVQSGVSNWVSWVCTTVSACSCATAENTNKHIAQRYSVKCSQFVNLWDSQLYSQSCPKLSNWEKLFSTRQCSALVYSFSSSTYEQAAAAIHTLSWRYMYALLSLSLWPCIGILSQN